MTNTDFSGSKSGGSARRTFAFFRALWLTNLKASMSLRGAFLLQATLMLVNNLIFFVVWWIFFQRFEEVGGFRLRDMLVLYGCVATSFGCAVVIGGGVQTLSRLIVDGDLDTFITQPKPVLPHVVGSRLAASGFGDIVSGIGLLAAAGDWSFARLCVLVVAIAASVSTLLSSGVLFHSAAFWLGRTESLARSMWEFLITFSLYPPTLFGGTLKLLLFTLLPAAFVGYFPAESIRTLSLSALACAVLGAAAFGVLAVFVFHRGLSRYESGNQFGVRA